MGFAVSALRNWWSTGRVGTAYCKIGTSIKYSKPGVIAPRINSKKPGGDNGRIEKQFLEWTKQLWQSYSAKALSDEDARQIIENMTGFFRILKEWKENGK